MHLTASRILKLSFACSRTLDMPHTAWLLLRHCGCATDAVQALQSVRHWLCPGDYLPADIWLPLNFHATLVQQRQSSSSKLSNIDTCISTSVSPRVGYIEGFNTTKYKGSRPTSLNFTRLYSRPNYGHRSIRPRGIQQGSEAFVAN